MCLEKFISSKKVNVYFYVYKEKYFCIIVKDSMFKVMSFCFKWKCEKDWV